MHNRRLFFWALTSALAGFLFGFDTIVISGAERRIQELWSLSAFLHGLVMSSALWGTVLGSLVEKACEGDTLPLDDFGMLLRKLSAAGLDLNTPIGPKGETVLLKGDDVIALTTIENEQQLLDLLVGKIR